MSTVYDSSSPAVNPAASSAAGDWPIMLPSQDPSLVEIVEFLEDRIKWANALYVTESDTHAQRMRLMNAANAVSQALQPLLDKAGL